MFNEGQKIVLERDYDTKIYSIGNLDFDRNNPAHYPDGKMDRIDWELDEKTSRKLNELSCEGEELGHIGLVLTKRGLRLITF